MVGKQGVGIPGANVDGFGKWMGGVGVMVGLTRYLTVSVARSIKVRLVVVVL